MNYTMTLILHQAWSASMAIKEHMQHYLHHRFHYGKLAEPLSESNLGLCKYRWIDGRQYTFVQPLNVALHRSILCAIVDVKGGSELDVTTDITCLAGPHLDFHGSELTLGETLRCLEIEPSTVRSLCICVKDNDDYTEASFTDLSEIIAVNKGHSIS